MVDHHRWLSTTLRYSRLFRGVFAGLPAPTSSLKSRNERSRRKRYRAPRIGVTDKTSRNIVDAAPCLSVSASVRMRITHYFSSCRNRVVLADGCTRSSPRKSDVFFFFLFFSRRRARAPRTSLRKSRLVRRAARRYYYTLICFRRRVYRRISFSFRVLSSEDAPPNDPTAMPPIYHPRRRLERDVTTCTYDHVPRDRREKKKQ